MLEELMARARVFLALNDDAHGYSHSESVENLTKTISKYEGGNPLVLSASSYLHDMCSHKGREYHVSEPALLEIRDELVVVRFPLDKMEPVIDVIRHHEEYGSQRNKELSRESLIFQDADRLDGIGAIGIGRTFYFGGANGFPFGTPEDMHVGEPYHIGQVTSVIQHFYNKLLNLKDNMNTEYARKIAQGRHDFVLEFLKRLKIEWQGKI